MEILRLQIAGSPPALPDAVLATLRQFVMRLLAKKPEERFADAKAAIAELRRAASPTSPPAKPNLSALSEVVTPVSSLEDTTSEPREAHAMNEADTPEAELPTIERSAGQAADAAPSPATSRPSAASSEPPERSTAMVAARDWRGCGVLARVRRRGMAGR